MLPDGSLHPTGIKGASGSVDWVDPIVGTRYHVSLPDKWGTVHAFPFANQLFLSADASGNFSGSTTWPAGVPTGTSFWFQFLVHDNSTVHGLTLSNGLKGTTP